eukprot:764923-Hanusia_phi.AAC.5
MASAMASAIGLSPSRKRGAEVLGKDATDAEKRKRFLSKLEALENRSLEPPTQPSPCATESQPAPTSASASGASKAHADSGNLPKPHIQSHDNRKSNNAGMLKTDKLTGSAKVPGKLNQRPDLPIALNSNSNRIKRQGSVDGVDSSGSELRENLESSAPDSASKTGFLQGRSILICLISLIVLICAVMFVQIQPNVLSMFSSNSPAEGQGSQELAAWDLSQCLGSDCPDSIQNEIQMPDQKQSSISKALHGFRTVASRIATQMENAEDLEIKERWVLDD